ncbi:hypothetical protein GCM10009785_10420 [Brooklawnia cerclae]|uniref:Uncharacterized protein n=1 Tax=Brooklawnia cerclae TaxID=349934 RepID=A0ABX0SNF9_9ACTN|nr:hypothetical protein [Brooklawnia cerclae]NIH58853.1 hypothetical protein [Brooklawnia cerclae]
MSHAGSHRSFDGTAHAAGESGPAGVPRRAWEAPQSWAPPVDPRPPAQWAPPQGWAPATTTPQRVRRRVPTAVKALVVGAVVLVLAIATVYIVGGFEQRQTYADRAVGEVLSLGPMDVTLDEAVTFDDYGSPAIEVRATCVSTLDTTSSGVEYALTNGGALAGVSTASGLAISEGVRLQFGVHTIVTTAVREVLAPGLQPMPCVLRFDMPAGTVVPDEVTVVLAILEWTEENNVKNGEDVSRTWNPSHDGVRVHLPVEHLTERP